MQSMVRIPPVVAPCPLAGKKGGGEEGKKKEPKRKNNERALVVSHILPFACRSEWQRGKKKRLKEEGGGKRGKTPKRKMRCLSPYPIPRFASGKKKGGRRGKEKRKRGC